MADLAAFRARRTEFDEAPDPQVQAALDDAAARMDRDVWGVQYDSAQVNLAAHLLAISPFGVNAKLSSGDGKSTYWVTYNEQLRSVVVGFAIT